MKLNLPNAITLSRIPLMFVVVWLMNREWTGAATLAFGLFLAGAVGDWLDGYLARKQNLVSTFGKFMDALSDKVFVLGIMVAMVDLAYFELPVGCVLLILSREFLVSGMRMAAAAKGVVVPADRSGKNKTLTQLIAIGFLLGAQMVHVDWKRWLPGAKANLQTFGERVHLIGFVGFIVGTFLAVWSGWRYIARHRALVFDEEPPAPPRVG